LCDDGASAPEKPTYLKEEKITGLDMGLEHYAICAFSPLPTDGLFSLLASDSSLRDWICAS
ncbi:hypothetical protein ACXGV5_004657, partial [Escherichia coli]